MQVENEMKRSTFLLAGWVVLLFLPVFLTACGGGSSGGAGSFAGTYSGTFMLTISGGGTTSGRSGSTVVVINHDGTVVVDPGTQGEARGTISGNTFTVTAPGSDLNESGVTCTGGLTMTGNGLGDTFTGNFSGTITCNGVPVTFSGTFTVTRVQSVSRPATGVVKQLRRIVR
jgi:hypothetical protein